MLVKLASGGMADVYLALHENDLGIEKLVVIKCLREHLREETGFIGMFLDEARTASTLTHPNIAPVFDAGEIDGVHFMAMEYVEGTDLRHLRRVRAKERRPPIPLKHALHVIGRVLSGLEYAHERTDLDGEALGIVHRDISPQNVLVEFAGGVKIVDFGVAKSALQLSEQSSMGLLKGKAAYMSPEQALGEPVDHRTDLFATAIILYELTTGTRLFKGPTELDTLHRVISETYPSPRSIMPEYPAGLDAVVMRALHRERAERYQSAREMRLDLSRWAGSVGMRPSEASFSDWLRSEVPELVLEQQELRGKVRSLAGKARSVPPPPSDVPREMLDALDSLRADRSPPASHRRVSSRPPPAGPRFEAAEPEGRDDEGTPENLRTLRSSVQTIPPESGAGDRARPGAPKPRRTRRRLVTGSMVFVVALGIVAIFGGWLAAPDSASLERARSSAAERVGAGFRPWSQRVRSWFTTSPAATKAKSRVEIETGPKTASVWLDEKPLPQRTAEVDRGSVHRLRVTAPGYYPLNMEVRSAREVEQVHVVLEAIPSTPDASSAASGSRVPRKPASRPRVATGGTAAPRTTGDTADTASTASPMWRPKGL
jgi:serine/threonine-protein kinase